MCRRGFTLIEILIVLTIIALLTSVVLGSLRRSYEQAYFSQARAQFKSFAGALELYLIDNGYNYPDDVDRNIPPGLEAYLSSDDWPSAPWPGSVYDWDNWEDPDTEEPIYQLSIRFCPIGGAIEECVFPDQDWAVDFDQNSSVYYCFEGPCRSHISEPIDHPGYCINCL
jgi:prepilin-type N-terminal cleavage/methylation domain-containing protein